MNQRRIVKPLGTVLVGVAAIMGLAACSSNDADQTSVPVTTTGPSAATQSSSFPKTTEPPPSPEKTPPGGIGGTG